MLRTIQNYWKSVLMVTIILYLSFAPPSDFKAVPKINIAYFDKFVHVILYTVLAIILIIDYLRTTKTSVPKTRFIIQCLLFPILMGGVIEIAQDQWFYPRTAEWIDWMSDILGTSTGAYIMYKLKKINLTP